MKKIAFIMAFAFASGSVVFAQQTVYVSAHGNENKPGLSEAEPTTFSAALKNQIMTGLVKRMVVIGTVDINSNGVRKDADCVFDIVDSVGDAKRGKALDEFVISGKATASAAERAVLSAKDSGSIAVWVRNCKVRFEFIEISGAEGRYGYGLYVPKDTQVTLGQGAIVRNNVSMGVFVANGGTCNISGGEVLNNNNMGVSVQGILNLRSGTIKDNTSSSSGGGVQVADGGHFTMSGGTITGNKTGTSDNYSGGGVYISKGGRFTMSEGSTITGNTSKGTGGGVFVEAGAVFENNGGKIEKNRGQGGNNNLAVESINRF
jgi:hypothetical protein